MTIFSVAAGGQSPAPVRDSTDADKNTLDWIALNGSAIGAIDVRTDVSDLSRFDSLVAGARIIGLGEQTHGTSEFSRLKLRLIAHAVMSHNVIVVGLEDAAEPVAAINSYLHGGDGQVEVLMHALSRLWRTEEVRSVLLWLREYNSSARARGLTPVDMVGVDVMNSRPTRESAMAESMVAETTRRGPAARGMFWTHNVHAAYTGDRAGFHFRRLIGNGYIAVGTATAAGTYRAHAPADSARLQTDGHVIAAAQSGSVELSLSHLSPRVGGAAQLYDVRKIIADPRGAWLNTSRNFHHIGTNVEDANVAVQNVGDMFDLLLFIPVTTSSHSIRGIEQ